MRWIDPVTLDFLTRKLAPKLHPKGMRDRMTSERLLSRNFDRETTWMRAMTYQRQSGAKAHDKTFGRLRLWAPSRQWPSAPFSLLPITRTLRSLPSNFVLY